MKILVITGSPHAKGTSACLADNFIQGATEAGHTIFRFDAAQKEVHACLGCEHCIRHNGQCVHGDAMEQLRPHLLEADMVVFVTSVYYFGMNAQLKLVIDRFFACNDALLQNPKKAMLLATSGDMDEWVTAPLELHYQTILRYLNWEDSGTLLARGMYTRADMDQSTYPQAAYDLGRTL